MRGVFGRARRRSAWKAGLASAIAATAFAQTANADTTFAAGSLIIPMDTDYQDAGMLTAFGLLDKLLRAGITVNWIIDSGKVCTVTGMTGATSGSASSGGSGDDASNGDTADTSASAGCSCSQAGQSTGGSPGLAAGLFALSFAVARRRRERQDRVGR